MNIPLKFNNRFVEQLPADSDKSSTPRQVFGACYSLVEPTKVAEPTVVGVSSEVASLIGLTEKDTRSRWFAETFVGNRVIDGMQPFAMCYGGHQFGHWAGQLGDGRAINLGEVVDVDGCNQTLQLKGAGLTPYSRTADGLAVLRSSIREFLCSEAMHHLGVPTTRALSIILTGEKVMRDMFYDGHPELEPGAVVCRVAPSFLRLGNYQLLAARQERTILKQLIDFTIRHDFPHLGEPCIEVYEQWFDEVCRRTADMVVHWMRVGFVHGVMNTDNISVLGLTIDYGPYGWLEGYDPHWTPNTTDSEGRRYSFGNQPKVAQWNLYQFANAIALIIERTENLEKSINQFASYYEEKSQKMYAGKLGWENHQGDSDQKLISELFEILCLAETDMTIFFRLLSQFKSTKNYTDEELFQTVEPAYYNLTALDESTRKKVINWLKKYFERIQQQNLDDESRRAIMNAVNPKYVLRNYLTQVAIDKATKGDFSEVEKLLTIMQNPYDEQPEYEDYNKKRPEWARFKAGCSMLSCSS
ncbi:protein adenylyltransferase SelO [Aliikangiella coralliicola]|uniref:Protein nucleotidyltransferase YdiU n=1 Tax=Aliikangiella coralliicola TaxID=2592383 RepID=A0A545UAP8_9GAMM|nr:YdiU family protein [Aliikangiella coralliicola]TQV86541.1 YdiU family protein [Aliikangiella coralliicola]